MNDILEKAIDEVMNTGILSLPTRKKIWLSFGEPDFEAENHPQNLKEGCKKRIELAKRCAKKVLPEWEKVRKSDLRPKQILKLVDNYLKGQSNLKEIKSTTKVFEEEVQSLIDNNPDKIEYEVSLIVTYVSYLLFNDEPLLDEDINCLDEELDPDMWDASYNAYRVYKSMDEMATEEMQKIKGMEFWLWYIEQSSEINNLKDIQQKIESCNKQLKKSMIEHQVNNNIIDNDISLYNFVKYIDDDYIYEGYEEDNNDINILAKQAKDIGKCNYCNQISTRVKREYKSKMDISDLNKYNKRVYLIYKSKKFYCDNDKCKNESFFEKPKPLKVIVENCKRYLSDESRKEKIQKLLGI